MFLCFKEFELPKFIFGHFAFSARYILGTSISANHVSGIVKTYFYAFDIFMQTIFMYDIRIKPDVIYEYNFPVFLFVQIFDFPKNII